MTQDRAAETEIGRGGDLNLHVVESLTLPD